jgi:hypothetical protein
MRLMILHITQTDRADIRKTNLTKKHYLHTIWVEKYAGTFYMQSIRGFSRSVICVAFDNNK